ncbi:MAG TPA: hypothetical protein VEY13_00350 [Rubrobacteraceae bacterium]|nr:hypothetical protein [Rubrobacteraceae bacterium]
MKRGFIAVLAVSVALLGTVAPAVADEVGGGKNKMPGMPFRWKATSPSTHEGDRYTLLVTNTGEEAQEARVRTVLMDHPENNTNKVEERIVLEPGEEREFTAENDYGPAEHFNTIIGSETQDLDLAVSIVDATGTETARFNQAAFQVQEGKGKGAAKGNGATANKHGHDEEFAIFVPTAFRDAALLSPLSLGVLAVAGTGLYAVRRRWAWTSPASSEHAGPVVLPPFWRAAAVGGLALSAILHVGLASAHFEEVAIQGIFFYAAGVVTAIVAAAILAWPSRPAYLAGAGISVALILLWAVFRIVPAPGAEVAEAVDLVGLFTKATELLAATACLVLWFRARRGSQPDRAEL